MLATRRASSRAGSSEQTEAIGILGAARAGQEVTKCRRQVRGIFKKFFNLCKNLSLMMTG
jgi:hypothetical protein